MSMRAQSGRGSSTRWYLVEYAHFARSAARKFNGRPSLRVPPGSFDAKYHVYVYYYTAVVYAVSFRSLPKFCGGIAPQVKYCGGACPPLPPRFRRLCMLFQLVIDIFISLRFDYCPAGACRSRGRLEGVPSRLSFICRFAWELFLLIIYPSIFENILLALAARKRKAGSLKFQGQSAFVPVQFGSYSAMKPRSFRYCVSVTHIRTLTPDRRCRSA